MAVGTILAPVGGTALYLYNSDVNHEKITWEKLWHHYEKTAMFGFTNNLWDTADLVTYESMNIGLGGAQVLRWVISALEDFKPVNPEHRFVTEIYSNNYRDMAINYIYGEKNYNGNEGLRSRTGDLILRNYQLKFIDQLPDALLDQLKTWESNGEDNKVSAYIHALEQINPVVVVNPKIPIEAKTINDVGEEWIKLRTWMIWEYMLNRAIDYHEDKNEKLGTSLEKLKIFNLPYSTFVELGEIAGNEFYKAADNYINHQSKKFYRELIEKVRVIRSQFGLDIDDLLYIEDHVSEQSFHQLMGKPGDIHKLMFAANFTDDSVSGGDTSDMLIASSKGSILNGEGGNDQLIGGSGDDHLNGGRGDDVLFGRKGNDHLNGGGGRNSLQGDEGRDFYYFNTADGDFDDTIIDSDGKGQLIIDGESLLGHFFDPKAGVINTWTAKIGSYDWQAVLTDNGDLILNTLQGNHRITIPGWNAMGNNGLEIILREYNSTIDPSVNMTLLGDWRTKILDETYTPPVDKKYYGQYDWNHWYTRNPNGAIDAPYGVAEKDFDDVINGIKTKKNNLKIYGFGGDDALGGSEGNDYIYGGKGRDLIVGAGGQDMLDGGADDDFIFSNSHMYVSERLPPDERWKMPDNGTEEFFAGRGWGVYRTSAGHWPVSGVYQQVDDNGLYGDNLFGGSGNDWVFGSNLKDFIYGDRNSDLSLPEIKQHGSDRIYGLGGGDNIEGNGGDDVIYGDGLTIINDMTYANPKNHGLDTIAGGYGNDVIVGGGNDDTIYGDDGDDHLYGDQGVGDYSAAQADYLPNEFQGYDTIFGGAGNDIIVGGGNRDELHGGLGNDRIWGDYGRPQATSRSFGRDEIWGDEGNDEINGGYDTDTLHGGAHDDILRGGAGIDYLYGDGGNDQMYGDGDYCPPELEDMDYMEGGNGNDEMFGGGGGDTLRGGDGDDWIYGKISFDKGEDGINHLFGDKGEDKLRGASNTDYIHGGEGNDDLVGYAGGDYLYGEEGNDIIWGDEGTTALVNPYGIIGDDHIYGGTGNDYLDGGNGTDTIHGDEDNDIVLGSFGDDDLFGDDGDDMVAGDAGNDNVHGGDGDDLLWGDWREDTDVILPSDSGSDHLFGGRGNDKIDGGYGDDELHGDEGDDFLFANAGNDILSGGEGNDELNAVSGTNRLYGDEGNDLLISGTGDDYLNGGLGNDVYQFKRNFGHDIVDNYDRLKGRTDYIHFLETQRNEVVLLRDNDDLIIRTLDGVNQVTVRKHFSEAEPWHAINGIRFADDDTWHPPHHHNNHAPEVVQPLDNLAVKAGSEVNGQITLSAISDPDGETLAYQLTMTDGIPLPDWLKFDAQTGAISGQALTDSSLLNLRLTGTDHAGASAFADFTLQVNAAPKVAHPLDNHREVEDRDFSFQLPQDTFTDPESDPLNLQLVQGNGEALPGWLHFDAASGTVSGHAPVGSPDLSLSLVATDPLGNQSHADFSLALTAPPQTVKSSWHGGTIYGKDGNDHLIGSNFNDRIHGGDGDDYLKAKFGNDVLDGGKGNDRLLGDWGNDEYFYRAGDGHDTIQDSQGKDTLILDGIRHSDIRFLLRGKDLVLEFTQDGGSIVIENHAGSGRMEHFRFADLHLDHRAVEDLMRRLGDNHGVI